ncbi:hypothetical protein GCM10028806_19630 [Spirosoma terrae]|uniref:Uncharacterized protein n=1 Tax=Spirosoma terrae TaxID=1968276 RepID=A0A6L9L2W7_9BACT|nr:hypothetical protein [Spirosoma terrae]NDU94720.1 hypothetical protein [Spirosoma terrae]
MIKNFVKRSQYEFIKLTDNKIQSVQVEGDEAYICVANYIGNGLILIRREREREFAKMVSKLALPADVEVDNDNLVEWQYLYYISGRVPLDTHTINGSFANKPLSSEYMDRFYTPAIQSEYAGIKETIDLRASLDVYPVIVCIETVHYVPISEINN